MAGRGGGGRPWKASPFTTGQCFLSHCQGIFINTNLPNFSDRVGSGETEKFLNMAQCCFLFLCVWLYTLWFLSTPIPVFLFWKFTMDGWVRVLHLCQQYFSHIGTMAGWTWKVLCNEAPFNFGKNLASSGIQTHYPVIRLGSANHSPTRTLLKIQEYYLSPFNSFPFSS